MRGRAPCRGEPGIAGVASAKGRQGSQRCLYRDGARFGTRAEGHGRVARTDRQPSVVSGTAQECFRYPGGVQPRGDVRTELHADPAIYRQRLLKHYQRIAGKDALQPAIQLIQAPIFHGHAFSIYMEMEQPVALGDLSQALAGEHVTVTRQTEDSPSNVNAAGQGDILVSLTRDENHPTGVWLWAASDNLRIAAVTAVECAETMTPTRPRGKIQ